MARPFFRQAFSSIEPLAASQLLDRFAGILCPLQS